MILADNIDKIVKYFANGIEKDKLKIGFEAEHFITDYNYNPIDYTAVCNVAKELSHTYDGSATPVLYNNKYIGFTCVDYAISFEPACQFEISISPQTDVGKLIEIYNSFLVKIFDILNKRNLKMHWCGYHPSYKADDLQIIPKERYLFMDEHFSKTGKHGKNMMRATCSVQVAIDYNSESDFVKKYRLANILSPVFALVCDNSPIYESKPNKMYTVRNYIWNDVDPKRCGIIPTLFDKNFGFRAYANYLYNTPIILAEQSDNTIYTDNLTPKDIYTDRLTIRDVEHILSMFFFDVRLKNYIEIRIADCMPKQYIFAYIMLIKCIFYDDNCKIAEALLSKYSYVTVSDIILAKQNIINNGYDAQVYGETAASVADTIADLIKKTNILTSEQNKIIEPLLKLISARKTIKEIR